MSTSIQINGVRTPAPARAIAYKYADPIEDARWIYDESDLRAIAAEDPKLLVPVPHHERTVWTDPDTDIEYDRDGRVTYDPEGTLPVGTIATPGGEDESYPLDDPRFQAACDA